MKNPAIFIFLKKPLKDKEKFVNLIIDNIPYSKENGYAGYISKNALKQFLTWSVYGIKQKELWKSINVKEIKQIIKDIIIKYKSVINKDITIFIFPTLVPFVIEKMDGVSGFTPWKNTIIININPTNKWKNALKET